MNDRRLTKTSALLATAFLALPLCAQQPQPVAACKAADVYAMKAEERGKFVHASLANSIEAIRQVDRHLAALPKRQLEAVRADVRRLIRECPYAHATFALIAAANDASGAFEGRLAKVHEAFTWLSRVAERLDIPAAMATVDVDAVVRRAASRLAMRRVDVIGHRPLARAYALLGTVKARVDASPRKKVAELQRVHAKLAAPTAGLWNFKAVMIRCATELEAALKSPQVGAGSQAVRARELLRTLRAHFGLYC